MASLEALEQDFRLIDYSFRTFCAAHGIFTVEDFLVHDLYELETFAERDCKQEKLKQGIRQMVSILEHKHKPWLNGMELLEDAEVNSCTLSTGWERIDALLQGGLRVGHITELVGHSSSGKTQVCLKCASHVASSYSGMVMFFDTGNSFSAKRIAQFLSLTGAANIEIKKNVQQVMSSIVCHSIFDMFTLLDMLRQLKNNLTSQVGCRVRMLIIDSLSSLIAPILGGGGAHGHALMLTAGFLLKELANEHNLSVLVTNHTVAGEAGMCKPALGESWKSIPHVRLLLSRNRATNGSRISILKHPYLSTGKTTEFMMM
ncbi:DNA repair protein RAD51 homolog 4 [Striga hermonthica]|uniref:DNA repair protein RAD51 homolog 4 n=1 Tax=Striga hermonthica TaxID=68872 RepID=A0A9N7RPY2_STRHE|nr:DNA repair protein RAD51 homolog 4 [Striga hermonthica]